MCCARCTKNNKCACSVKSGVSDYKDITICEAKFDRDHVYDRNRIYILEKYAFES